MAGTRRPGARRYHADQVQLAEQQRQWFAVAFHLGRILLDDPDNADLERRRDEALQKHAESRPAAPRPMEKAD